MPIGLCDIPLPTGNNDIALYEIKAFAQNPNRCEFLKDQQESKRKHPDEYRFIMVRLLTLRNERKETALMHSWVSSDAKGREVYELCHRNGGHARAFFFYSKSRPGMIVFTNIYWKGGGDRRQSRGFDIAAERKDIFEEEYRGK